MSRYRAAFINVSVEVESYEDVDAANTVGNIYVGRRRDVRRRSSSVENFKDDEGLDKAVGSAIFDGSTICSSPRGEPS
jgi:hypothetical protein